MGKQLLLLLLSVVLLFAVSAAEDADWSIDEYVILPDGGGEIPIAIDTPQDDAPSSAPETAAIDNPARQDFIERIIAMGKDLYDRAGGKPQRAHYAGDTYVCKNFTTYLFRKNRDDFCMAEFPGIQLVIPDNLPAAQCKPYYYGFLWKDVPAEKGNPFYVAEQFIYDTDLSYEENLALATEMMKHVQRGDFFQMSADYSAGTGAHSAIMIAPYDKENNLIHWMDSNMRGTRKNGIRYGYVQFDAQAEPEWWAEAFCHKKRGATIYRLRDDIAYVSDLN